ncbi:thiosulfate oxidation carrier complex protein SoxZ [Rhodobacteraceae bacterium 2376]|uniref:Thiosulfate oxidation carrier complex protein SoxZ n=1 Tax=Rhabdonatronobacter sediminivivens TaxID=2743469 RepID=A0A7Z0KXG7_9RHOB|nr:thiosulfate oxidation carrier complex protein SoxZ [Rhabdonatronobacter sediminivivens]NYS24862.1 thiosulfate oxidation carrier complex protein SoxZ [Rhabdonatronobacter sediminivivens]
MSTPRVRLPRSASAGEEIEIRTLIDHPMITGVSSSDSRNMLERFEARLNGDTVFRYDFGNGSAANPTFTFYVRAAAPGDFEFIWTHEDGTEFRADGSVSVS